MKKLILLMMILLFSISSCNNSKDKIKTMRSKIAKDYPLADSSTSAHPLQRKLACDLLEVPWTWSNSTAKAMQRTIIPDPKSDISKEKAKQILSIKPSGTHGSYVKLIDKKTDVILVARAPSQDEIEYAAKKAVKLDVKPVALDAFVFLVHKQNPINNLSIEQIKEIYTGKLSSWDELAVKIEGKKQTRQAIHAYQRNRNSGSQQLMEKLVMKDLVMIEADDLISNSMLGPYNAIGGNKFKDENGDVLGLGYTVYFYAMFMFPHDRVKIISIDGVKPNSDTIAKREYSLCSEVFVAIRENEAADSTALIFRDWLFTRDGQNAIAQSGYVPIIKP